MKYSTRSTGNRVRRSSIISCDSGPESRSIRTLISASFGSRVLSRHSVPANVRDLGDCHPAALADADAEATDEELLAALDEALEEQADPEAAPAAAPTAALPEGFTAIDSTVLAELQSNARQGAAARAEQERARRDGIVKDALKDGRIAFASSEAIRKQLDSDEAGTVAFLATLPKNAAVPTNEVGHADSVTSADDALYASLFGDEKGA